MKFLGSHILRTSSSPIATKKYNLFATRHIIIVTYQCFYNHTLHTKHPSVERHLREIHLSFYCHWLIPHKSKLRGTAPSKTMQK